MIARVRQDCDEFDVDAFKDACKPEDLEIGWFHLMTEADREEMGAEQECEWYVSGENKSRYKVWIYFG